MSLKTTQSSIISQLKTAHASLAVEPYPDVPDEYKLLKAQGALLVMYRGGGFERPRSENLILQEQTLTWRITVVARSLSKDNGIIDLLDSVRSALTGFSISGFEKMFCVNEGFQSYSPEKGLWSYYLDVAHEREWAEGD